MPISVPPVRLRAVNDQPCRPDRDYVLYWLTAYRRLHHNFSLDHAIAQATQWGKPLVILEALRCGYRWRCDRFHAFIMDGMADNLRTVTGKSVFYYPYVEPTEGAGKGLLATLAENACLVVTDDFPCYFLPRMIEAAGHQISVRLEAVDSNGLYPIRATERVFQRAHDFRRHLHRELLPHLPQVPQSNPLVSKTLADPITIPSSIKKRWPSAEHRLSNPENYDLKSLPLDHAIAPTDRRGGSANAVKRWRTFLKHRLKDYPDDRNLPEKNGASGLSPYLHFGHLSTHQILEELAKRESWEASKLAGIKPTGSREGWWQMSEAAEAFLDEIVTWREVGFNMSTRSPDYDQYDSLPDWARRTLKQHDHDPREFVYTLEEFEQAKTHDELWNAAQNELKRRGSIHNYLRMLWGKKILEWTSSPREALDILIELNNKYALDGRNPNSYSGIFWCLGRYDRAWGPERPVFGKIRFMSSDSTRRKFSVKSYIEQYRQA